MEKQYTMVYFSLRESKQNKKSLSSIEVSISTKGERIYFNTGLHNEFILNKYDREDLYLSELNIGFILGFHSFLLGEKNMG